MKQTKIEKIFSQSVNVIQKSQKLNPKIQNSIDTIIGCYKTGNKVITFGNGGSAADAQHLAAELIGRFKLERKSLAALSLTTDTSILTALGNDYGFENVFARQCESMVSKGDVIIAISTSGKSKNIIKGIKTAKSKGAKIIVLTGSGKNNLDKLADILLQVPSESTPRIQEGHRILIHVICELVEEYFKK